VGRGLTCEAGPLSFEVEPLVIASFGFAKHELGVAIAAADELARRYRDGTARRLHPDGSIDVAAMEGRVRPRFLHYRVSAQGTAALVETASPPGAHGVSVAMIFVGIAVFAGGVVSVIALGDAAPDVMGIGLVGFLVALIGVVTANRFGLEWYVRETFGSDSGWQQIFGATMWAPRSIDQLRAVELLADRHDGKALARPHPDGGTEVRTLHRGRLYEHVIAPDGAALLVRRGKRAASYALGVATIAIGAGGAVATTIIYNFSDLDVTIAFSVSLGFVFGGAMLRGVVTLENRAKNHAVGGWHLVQTKPDDAD